MVEELSYIKVPLHTIYKLTPLAYGKDETGDLQEVLSFYYSFANCHRLSAGEVLNWSGVCGHLPGETRGIRKSVHRLCLLKKSCTGVGKKKLPVKTVSIYVLHSL